MSVPPQHAWPPIPRATPDELNWIILGLLALTGAVAYAKATTASEGPERQETGDLSLFPIFPMI